MNEQNLPTATGHLGDQVWSASMRGMPKSPPYRDNSQCCSASARAIVRMNRACFKSLDAPCRALFCAWRGIILCLQRYTLHFLGRQVPRQGPQPSHKPSK